MTNPTLPKGITRLPVAPPAKADVGANVQTAADMHTTVGHDIEVAADWLLRQLPGEFLSLAEAVAAIRKVL